MVSLNSVVSACGKWEQGPQGTQAEPGRLRCNPRSLPPATQAREKHMNHQHHIIHHHSASATGVFRCLRLFSFGAELDHKAHNYSYILVLPTGATSTHEF